MHKGKKAVRELRAKQDRLLQERRKDFPDSRAKLDLEMQRKKEKTQFAPGETVLREEEAVYETMQERAPMLKRLAEFQ
jgi:hypothetical protein